MNYHLPINQGINTNVPRFMVRNNELVTPLMVLDSRQYPKLRETLVKIVARDGSKIFVPLHKLSAKEV
jgi:hypothetical protein